MIHPAIYRQAVPLDSKLHRTKKLSGDERFPGAAAMQTVYVSVAEMHMAALDYVVVFIEVGTAPAGGKAPLMPVALLGTQADENLYADADGRWTGRYVPAFFRRYPFATAPRQNPGDKPLVLVDVTSTRLSDDEGAPLFDDDGKPTTALTDILNFLNMFDREADGSREFCALVQKHGLLKPMAAQMTMPDGEELSVNGFFVFDEEKMRALPAAIRLELLGNGVWAGLQAHQLSLGNLRYLTERKARRAGKSAATWPV